jgi:hypothetical protein
VTVEVLYVDDCPNWRECGERIAAALKAAGLDGVAVNYRRIDTSAEAAALPFAGSRMILKDLSAGVNRCHRENDLTPSDARIAVINGLRAPVHCVEGLDG